MGSTSSHGDKHNRQIMAVENPRWPHTCKVYRMRGVSNFSKGEQEIIYEGPCRKYGNTSIRTFTGNDGVQRADYALSIPGQIRGISTGVLIDVEDLVRQLHHVRQAVEMADGGVDVDRLDGIAARRVDDVVGLGELDELAEVLLVAGAPAALAVGHEG